MTTPIPIDVLAVFERCIRQAMDADPNGAALPAVPDSALRDAVEAWRVASPAPPAGATSLIEQTQAVLTTLNRDLYEPFRLGLATGRILQPLLASGALRLEPVATVPLNSTRALFLIEEYRLTSFLGRYGVGRTLSTMSLLPGEETTIRLKTWTTTSTTRTDTSSVVDSEEVTVSNKFATKLSEEASDTRSRQDSSSWHAETSGSATWAIGVSLEASAGASADTQTSRESFARTASEQVAENAREARSQRKTEVATSTTAVSTSGEEDYSERVIRNINLRRTLNFVFRELNQEYITRLHMTGARVAEATPGQQGTWVEYPLSQLPELLQAAIAEHHWAEVAGRVIAAIATVNDAHLRPVHPLDVLT